ncbi:hypothetical protein JCGZ_01759 [Jatropha curcas]|uniref:Aminotransferase-like plant mobile domain-containing protein n=1 Tax=Jatropha curcas TaxID=180498 RepID=A0A067JGA0_JATCU|nr:hypothetical protein JCGZ_01759 [Jatropha curcas]
MISDEGFLESLGISLDEVNVTADADTHASVTGIYVQTWAFEYFPYTRPELIHTDLGLGLVPLAWIWYQSNLHTVRRKKSLRDLRTFFDTCSLEQVEVGPMTARLQSWIQADPHFQRSDALSRRRVILSQPVLRRYFLGERVDLHIRGCRSVPHSPPENLTPRRRPMTDPTSSTPIEGPSRAWPSRSAGPSRAPRAISEATGPLHPGLANLRLPYSIPYYPPDGTLAFREVSLESADRLDLPPEDITEIKTDKSLTKRIHKRFDIDLYFSLYDFQVPIELVNQMMELILGMQQELTSSWTHRAFDDQRRRRPCR